MENSKLKDKAEEISQIVVGESNKKNEKIG